MRDKSQLISPVQADTLLSKNLVKKMIDREPYLYIWTKKSIYKVSKESIDIPTLSRNYPIEVQTTDITWMDTIYLFIILGAFGYMLRLMNKQRESNAQMMQTQMEKADDMTNKDTLLPIHSTVRFSDVAGIKDAKDELEEIIDFLKYPQKFRELGIYLPKGVLLVGPPGVGKTFVAKAVAGEAAVPFFYQSGASFVHIFVGMGAKRVHELFQVAKKMAPSIIFIDEIDAVGKNRAEFGNDEREATLNQLLTEMDGFEENSGVIVMAATNRIEMLDDALLRSGRFDRRIHISLPDLQERMHTIEMYLHNKPNSVDIEPVARMTVGFSAAALSTLVNEAALHAMRNHKRELDNTDFEAVKDKVISGKRKILSFSEDERQIQAVYQSGKAVIATWLDVKFDKIGILMTRLRDDDREISSRTELVNRIKVYLAGAVATEQVYAEQFSNASSDMTDAIELAHTLVHHHNMGEGFIPNSDEIEKILDSAYAEVGELLHKLDKARILIEERILSDEYIDHEGAKGVIREIF